ncbi:hypothetical protein OPV22_001647 [Ensete ventricosum]|uniref:Uncharacterized protein n=1 Tax=Ensete ventricosum TaxID=4639 RepID=A0AAV8RWD5_ENSVE|nr:hypothetical protein OPV22_001647 [Ensete ventricosum]
MCITVWHDWESREPSTTNYVAASISLVQFRLFIFQTIQLNHKEASSMVLEFAYHLKTSINRSPIFSLFVQKEKLGTLDFAARMGRSQAGQNGLDRYIILVVNWYQRLGLAVLWAHRYGLAQW